MDLTTILDRQAVRFQASAPNKRRLIQQISDHAAMVYGLEASEVFDVLMNREKLGSTGVGRGIAIPHARMSDLNRVIGHFTRVAEPVEFESLDHRPVDLLFTLLAPENEGAEHLKALALVSRTMRNKEICRRLRANAATSPLYSVLTTSHLQRVA